MPSTNAKLSSWRDWKQQLGGITLHEWIPWDVMLSKDVDRPAKLVLYPCETCLRICRFTPPELLTLKSTTVGGLQPGNQTEPSQGNIRHPYRLFDIEHLPLLELPLDRRHMDQTYTSRPYQTTQTRVHGALGRLPLLERHVPQMYTHSAPVKKRFRLSDEDRYGPDCDMIEGADGNLSEPINGSEADLWMETRNAQRKRLCQFEEGAAQSDNKRVNYQPRAGGTDGQHTNVTWWMKPNPWQQKEVMMTDGRHPTWHTCEHDWRRPQDTIDGTVHALYIDVAERFTLYDVSKLADRGDEIVRQIG